MSTSPTLYPGILGASSAIDISQLTRFKLAIVGRVKTGKSWLACTMPGEKYVFDFDNRKESLAGKPNVTIKTYQDVLQSKPLALAELEKDIKMFEYLKAQGKAIPDVFVLDSATWLVKACENDLMKSVSRLSRDVKTSAMTITIPAGWDIVSGIRNIIENVISRFSVLGHVIVIFHEEPEKDKIKSTPDEPVYTGAFAVHPFYLRTLLSTFNETWRIEIKNGEYLLTCKPSSDFGASTTLLIDKNEKADISGLIEKHKKRLLELK
jgi:AAA domain